MTDDTWRFLQQLRNATDLKQAVDFIGLMQVGQIVGCNKSHQICKIRLDTT